MISLINRRRYNFKNVPDSSYESSSRVSQKDGTFSIHCLSEEYPAKAFDEESHCILCRDRRVYVIEVIKNLQNLREKD